MIRVGGLTPLTAIDYPGCLSAVVFCQGCPWRCGYCHNPHLLQRSAAAGIEWKDVRSFLFRRIGLLDAVVFSGGEPTLQKSLPQAMEEVRSLGFRIGMHTSGAHPRRLEAALPFVDWVGMDVKAPFDSYESVTHVRESGKKARRSIESILKSGVDCEFRTTVHPEWKGMGEIEKIARELEGLGAGHYRVQPFRPGGCLDFPASS